MGSRHPQVSVALVGRDRDALGRAAEGVTLLGTKAIAVVADCTVGEQLVQLRSTVDEQLGTVDILAVFAGGNGMPVATTDETGSTGAT